MHSETFQAFICSSFDDYGFQITKTPNQNLSKLEYCEKVHYRRLKVSHESAN